MADVVDGIDGGAPLYRFSNCVEEEIPASRLTRYPANREPSKAAVAAMRESILENGQLQPVTVRPVTVDGADVLQIIFGETRWLGCRGIAEDHPVRCYVMAMDDKEAARIHAVENFRREELDDIDAAKAMGNMRDAGWSVEEISGAVGMSDVRVRKRLQLLKLDGETQEAVREKNISLDTASALEGLSAEARGRALEKILRPTHAANPLTEREALRMLARDFIEPMKKEKEWEKRRRDVEATFPGVRFLPYAEARGLAEWNSGYVRADAVPGWNDDLSAGAKDGELVVPTWGELAERHGAEVVTGLDADGEAVAMVLKQPLVDAELARCEVKPGECVFRHPKQVSSDKLAAEKRKHDAERRKLAGEAELTRALGMIREPGAMTDAGARRLCQALGALMLREGLLEFHAGLAPGFPGMKEEGAEELLEIAVEAYLKNRGTGGFEGLGRLVAMSLLDVPASDANLTEAAGLLVETRAVRARDFPVISAFNAKGMARGLAAQDSDNTTEIDG